MSEGILGVCVGMLVGTGGYWEAVGAWGAVTGSHWGYWELWERDMRSYRELLGATGAGYWDCAGASSPELGELGLTGSVTLQQVPWPRVPRGHQVLVGTGRYWWVLVSTGRVVPPPVPPPGLWGLVPPSHFVLRPPGPSTR